MCGAHCFVSPNHRQSEMCSRLADIKIIKIKYLKFNQLLCLYIVSKMWQMASLNVKERRLDLNPAHWYGSEKIKLNPKTNSMIRAVMIRSRLEEVMLSEKSMCSGLTVSGINFVIQHGCTNLLTKLNLTGICISPLGLQCIAANTGNLKLLTIGESSVQPDKHLLKIIQVNASLESFSMVGNKKSIGAYLLALIDCPNLRTLMLVSCPMINPMHLNSVNIYIKLHNSWHQKY